MCTVHLVQSTWILPYMCTDHLVQSTWILPYMCTVHLVQSTWILPYVCTVHLVQSTWILPYMCTDHLVQSTWILPYVCTVHLILREPCSGKSETQHPLPYQGLEAVFLHFTTLYCTSMFTSQTVTPSSGPCLLVRL